MVAFLDCVQQFKEEVEKGDTGFCLPYRSDYLQTSAMRTFVFMLINQGTTAAILDEAVNIHEV